MSKKRRTKKEKMIAGLKRQLTNKENILTVTPSSSPSAQKTDNHTLLNYQISPHVNISKTPPKALNNPNIKRMQKDYSYVVSDMKNTGIIMFLILAVNLVILVLVKRNLLNLKFLGL